MPEINTQQRQIDLLTLLFALFAQQAILIASTVVEQEPRRRSVDFKGQVVVVELENPLQQQVTFEDDLSFAVEDDQNRIVLQHDLPLQHGPLTPAVFPPHARRAARLQIQVPTWAEGREFSLALALRTIAPGRVGDARYRQILQNGISLRVYSLRNSDLVKRDPSAVAPIKLEPNSGFRRVVLLNDGFFEVKK